MSTSRFAEVTEDNILRMQDNAIPNYTKKLRKQEWKLSEVNNVFNIQYAHMSSVFCSQSLSQSWPPSSADASRLERQLSLHGSISKSHPSQLNFHWAKRLQKNWMSLSLKMIVISNNKHMA